MEQVRRLAATICLLLHGLIAAAGPVIDARVHGVDVDGAIAVSAATGDASGALLHAELCGLCRTLQQIDAPPASSPHESASDDGSHPTPSARTVSLASTLRTSSLGARAPPV